MWARRAGRRRQDRGEQQLNLTRRDRGRPGRRRSRWCPGVSRSGATISAGLFRGLDRVTRHPAHASSCRSRPCSRPGSSSSRTRSAATSASGETARRHGGRVRRRLRRRSPGCCGSSPTTRSRGSCPTGSRSGAAAAASLRRRPASLHRDLSRAGSQPAGLLEEAPTAPTDADAPSAPARTGSRAPSRARACGRSSCRRRRRSGSARRPGATPAEILRMSSFCCTEIWARWASKAVDSSCRGCPRPRRPG